MNALMQKDMTPQAIRMAIIGALRLAGDAVCHRGGTMGGAA